MLDRRCHTAGRGLVTTPSGGIVVVSAQRESGARRPASPDMALALPEPEEGRTNDRPPVGLFPRHPTEPWHAKTPGKQRTANTVHLAGGSITIKGLGEQRAVPSLKSGPAVK